MSILRAGLVALALLAGISDALACSCRRSSREAADANADFVFEGRVIKTGEDEVLRRNVMRVRVLHQIKGKLPQVVTITAKRSRTACGILIPKGQTRRFRVFGEVTALTTGLCTMIND